MFYKINAAQEERREAANCTKQGDLPSQIEQKTNPMLKKVCDQLYCWLLKWELVVRSRFAPEEF